MYKATSDLNDVVLVWQNDGFDGVVLNDGLLEGLVEGSIEGSLEGSVEGTLDGLVEGLLEGFLLGTLVGAGVVTNTTVLKVTDAVVVSFSFMSATAF